MNQEELIKRFTYHVPHGSQAQRYTQLQEWALNFALKIVELTPESREQSLAITFLEQASMFANAAIARREEDTSPDSPPIAGQAVKLATEAMTGRSQAEEASSPGISKEQLDSVYRERNLCVALIAQLAKLAGLKCGIRQHEEDQEWDNEWRNIFFLDLPTGQVSWHLHESELQNFPTLMPYTTTWDGHTTEEKYNRLIAFTMLEVRYSF